MNRIRRHLSAKLSIGITLLAAPIFVLALGILFLYSRHLIRQETMKQATRQEYDESGAERSQLQLLALGRSFPS